MSTWDAKAWCAAKAAIGLRRRWLQMSVRTLLAAVLVLSVCLAFWTARARRQEAIVWKVIRSGGGGVTYRHEVDAAGKKLADAMPPGPAWLRRLMGNHAFFDLHGVGSNSLDDEDLACLAEFSSIETLQLGEPITDKGLAHVARLKNLRVLDCESSKITDRGVKSLARLERLETLALTGAQVTDGGLEPLASLKNLKYLNLTDTQVTAEGIARLREKLPQAKVYSKAPFAQEEREYVQALIRAGARFQADKEGCIKTVRFIGPDVEDDDLLLLVPLQRLQLLFLLNTRVTSQGIERLRASHPDLKVMPHFRLPVPQEADAVAALQRCGAQIWHDAQEYVQNVSLTDETLDNRALVALHGLTRIKSLNVQSSRITSEGMRHIQDLTSLELLWLWYSPISDAGLEHLRGLTAMKNLVVQGERITDEGLASLSGMKELKKLGLRGTSITGPGLTRLDTLTDLEDFDLSGGALGDEGLALLPKWPKLKKLNLTATHISDEGLRHLKGRDALEILLLNGTQITDRGLLALASLPGIKSLHLRHTRVTHEGMQQFLDQKPDCKVHR